MSIGLDGIDSASTLYLFYVNLLKDGPELSDNKGVLKLRDEYKFELLLRQFDLKSQLRIRNIKNELDRYVKLINMLALKYVITKVEMKEGQLEETRNEYGKPKLSNRDYQYNISDENGIVSIAIGFNDAFKDKEIGIDLANPKDIENFKLDSLESFYKVDFRDIFNDLEIKWLDEQFKSLQYDEKLFLLSQMWALKESYCKYLGVGITAGMHKFQFVDFQVLKSSDNKTHNTKMMANLNLPQINEVSKLNHVNGYEAMNKCLVLPETGIICSVFSHYTQLQLVRIDAEDIIDYFSKV